MAEQIQGPEMYTARLPGNGDNSQHQAHKARINHRLIFIAI